MADEPKVQRIGDAQAALTKLSAPPQQAQIDMQPQPPAAVGTANATAAPGTGANAAPAPRVTPAPGSDLVPQGSRQVLLGTTNPVQNTNGTLYTNAAGVASTQVPGSPPVAAPAAAPVAPQPLPNYRNPNAGPGQPNFVQTPEPTNPSFRPTAAAAPVAATAVNAAEEAAPVAARSLLSKGIGVAGRVAGSAVRYGGPVMTALTAGTRIANAEGDAFQNTLARTGSNEQARTASAAAGLRQTETEGAGIAGGLAGARLGASLPIANPYLKGGAALAGGVIGSLGGAKALESLTGDGSSNDLQKLPQGVYQVNAVDDVPRLDANGKGAPIPLNTDIARLQSGDPAVAADFDRRFGAGTAAQYMGTKIQPAPAVNAGVSAAAPNFSDVQSSARNALTAGATGAPGTAVFNGRTISPDEINRLANTNVIPADAFRNPAPGVAASLAGGSLAMGDGPVNRQPQFSGSSGNEGGNSNFTYEDRQAAQALAKQRSDLVFAARQAINNGKRKTAGRIIELLTAVNHGQTADAHMKQAERPLRQGGRTPEQEALTAAQIEEAQANTATSRQKLAAESRLGQLQDALVTAKTPQEQESAGRALALLSGRDLPQKKVGFIDVPIPGDPTGQKQRLPYDPETNQILMPKGLTAVYTDANGNQQKRALAQ